MSNKIQYLVYGCVIWGCDGDETIVLPREVKAGDVFMANGRWFKVIQAGLYGGIQNPAYTHVMKAYQIEKAP